MLRGISRSCYRGAKARQGDHRYRERRIHEARRSRDGQGHAGFGRLINVLRGGVYAKAEWENAGWRHQVFTQRIVVVIEFESESELTIITAWRIR